MDGYTDKNVYTESNYKFNYSYLRNVIEKDTYVEYEIIICYECNNDMKKLPDLTVVPLSEGKSKNLKKIIFKCEKTSNVFVLEHEEKENLMKEFIKEWKQKKN